jgi:hypothetical protein
MNVFNFTFFFVCLLLTHVIYITWTTVFRKKFSSAPSLSKYYELTLDCVLVNNTIDCNCLNTRCFMWCQIPVTKYMFWSCNSLIDQDQSVKFWSVKIKSVTLNILSFSTCFVHTIQCFCRQTSLKQFRFISTEYLVWT